MRSGVRARGDKLLSHRVLLGATCVALILNALAGCSQQTPIEKPAALVRYTNTMEHCDAAPMTDTDTLATLLKAKKFQELDAELRKFQAATEKNIICEQSMFKAFIFASDPRVYSGSAEIVVEALLGQWIQAMPESFVPYSVRATFFVRQGYDRRGTAYASKTSNEQFRQMDEKFELAEADIDKGITLYPRHLNFYCQDLRIARAGNNGKRAQDIYRKAIEQEPGTLGARASMMVSLEPRWGGSIQAMASFAEDAQKFIHLNPRLRSLMGYPYVERSQRLDGKDRNKAKLAELNKALSYGEIDQAYYWRGQLYYSMGYYSNAIQDFDHHLDYIYNLDVVTRRALAYHYVGDTQRALEELDRLLARFPNDLYALSSRGWVNRASGRFEQARVDYERYVALRPKRSVLEKLAEVLSEGLGRHDEAAKIYARLMELSPDNLEYRFLYGEQLHQLGYTQAREILTSYLASASPRTSDSIKHIRQAKQYLGLTSFDPERSENRLRGLRHLGVEGETQVSANSETNLKLQ